jgi:hypothetical protein
MAQAECVTTANRELMSRGRPPNNIPHQISVAVDSEDLESRADHLEKVFAALHVYLTAIIADTAQNIPSGTLDRRYFDNPFQELSGDAVGVIRNAAEDLREHENWRAT